MILNVYAPKHKYSEVRKRYTRTAQITYCPHKVILGDFNTFITLPLNRLSRQGLNIKMLRLTDDMNQMVLTDIYRTFHTNRKGYTFFSQLYGPFSNIEHIFRDKASLNKYKKTETMLCILFDQHPLELDISIKRNNRRFTNSRELNNSKAKLNFKGTKKQKKTKKQQKKPDPFHPKQPLPGLLT